MSFIRGSQVDQVPQPQAAIFRPGKQVHRRTDGDKRFWHHHRRSISEFQRLLYFLVDPNITAAKIIKAESDRLEIEAGEPPALRVLDLICHNELARAMGLNEKELFDIKLWRAMFAHLFDVFPSSIKRVSN